MTPRFRRLGDRIAVLDPLSREKLEALAPGWLAEVLWERYGHKPWRQVWPRLDDELTERLSEADVADWQPMELVSA